jgi:excisionase family DNA binding protein
MTTAEAARLLSVSPRYVRALLEQGRLTRTNRTGANHQLDAAEIRRLARSRQLKPGGR